MSIESSNPPEGASNLRRIYRFLATADHPAARFVRTTRSALRGIALPAPAIVVKPMLWVFLAVRTTYYFLMRVFICEPLFKAYCRQYGKGVHTAAHVHWIQGKGDINLGDNVLLTGKCSIKFAARYTDRPVLNMGNNVDISNGCSFVVGKEISIGNNCMLGGNVTVRDSSGHPVDYEQRKAGTALDAESVQPVRIEDDVWIGAGAVINQGVTVGTGSVVAGNAIVATNVAPYAIVAGNPARKVGDTRKNVG